MIATTTTTASAQALATVRGVKNRHRWGLHAAWRYAERRGADAGMYFICLMFEIRRRARLQGCQ